MAKSKGREFRRFDSSVKERALELLRSGRTAASVARELGVSYPTLINWKKGRYIGKDATTVPEAVTQKLQLLELEIEYLKKRELAADELEKLRLEVDYLKKKLAIYESK